MVKSEILKFLGMEGKYFMKKARILYGLSFAVTLGVMILFGERYAYVIFYSLILLLGFSLLTLFVSQYFIEISEAVEKTDVFKNESLSYKARISNNSIFPYPKVTFEFYHGDFIRYERLKPEPVDVMSRECVIDGYQISFPYRGTYDVGIEKFYVSDFLGLFRIGFSKKEPVKVTVFPEKIENFTLNLRSELLSKTVSAFDMLNDNQSEVSDVRKYVPSDDYKKIHWKLTAKKNEFIVKNYLSSVLNKTYVFLDMKSVSLKGGGRLWFEDKMISYAAAAVHYCVANRFPVSLNCGPEQSDMIEINGFADIDGLFRKLAEISFCHESYLFKTLNESFKDEDFYNMVVFIYDIDDELFDSLNNLSEMGHNVIIYYLSGEGLKPDLLKQSYLTVLSESGVTVNMLYL